MTLNLSHHRMSPPDENFLSSSMRFESQLLKFDFDEYRGPSLEHEDIVDRLPADPFSMNIGATVTALDALTFIWNSTIRFPLEQGNMRMSENFNQAVDNDVWFKGKGFEEQPCSSIFHGQDAEEKDDEKKLFEVAGSCSSQSVGDPHDALIYVLGYLGVHELLSTERVCKSLHFAIQNDPLLWRNVCIDQPLNDKIDDDALLKITSRAQGKLQCLSLLKCSRVTDDCLKCVLERNPGLAKLNVPECTKLSVEGIVNNLKDFQSSSASGLKQLRIGGRYDVTREHFDELKLLLPKDACVHSKPCKPRIYHGRHSTLPSDEEDRVIDIEACPRCNNMRLVYDCPLEGCHLKQSSTQICRACTICIARCIQCGRCINDDEYVETFCLDILCLYCC